MSHIEAPDAVREGRSNRCRILAVSPSFITALTGGPTSLDGPFRVVRDGLPPDAKPLDVFYDHVRRCFGIIVESESYEPVPEGQEIPWAEDPWLKLVPATYCTLEPESCPD